MTIIANPHSLSDAIETWKQYLSTHDPEDVWFFVENGAINQAIAKQIEIPVLKSQILTLQEFATSLVADRCKSTKLLTPEEQLIILHEILCDSKWNTNNTSLSFVHELMGRYNFFRKNGISLDEYRGTDTKHGILCDIFDRYQKACGDTKLDSVGIIQKAIDILKTDNPVKYAVIYHLNPTELLLQQLRDAIRGDGTNITEYQAPDCIIERPATLKDIKRYTTARDEVESVLDTAASLIEGGCDSKDILILTPSLRESASLIRDAISDFYYLKDGTYLPLTCTSLGTPLSTFPIIQCVMAALSTQLTGFRLADLETVASPAYFMWPKEHDLYITPDRLRELSIIANVTDTETEWRSAAYRLSNDATLKYDAARIEPLLSWLKKIASPKPSQTIAERVSQLERWLAGCGWTSAHVPPQEHKARSLFLEYLALIAGEATGSIPCTLSEFVATIRQYVQSKEVPVPAKNDIRLEKLRKAADLKAKHVFIIGLTADNLPSLTTTLSPFSMKETNDLCRLPDGTPFSLPDRQFEETRVNFAAALQTAEEALHLSCYSSNGSNSTAPSTFLTRLAGKGEPEPVSAVSVTHSVWSNQIEAGRRIRTADENTAPLLGVIDPDSLAERIARETNGYTSDFSGSEQIKALFDAQNADRKYSPTEIETYLGCPYRWYLDKHLALRNPQDKYAEHSKLGTLIHGALEDFFSKTPREDMVKQPFDTLYVRLLECVHDQLESEHVIDAPSWDAKKDWYQDRVPGFEGIFRQFLEQEIAFAKEGWTTTEEMTEYKLANPDPVEIKLGEKTMKIQGSIDRIMTNGESFRIVDYKTGKSFKDDLKKGRLVQIPVYTEAYRVKNGGVPDPGYYFKLTRDECKPVPLPLKDGEDYRNVYYRVLELVFATRDRMRAGDCSRAEKCEDKYCPYKAMCRASNIAEGDDE